MKGKAKRLSKAKRSSLDRISTLPSTIIENILCLVPIKDAVRTSILSKEWRYIWTRIPKLVFNKEDMFYSPGVKTFYPKNNKKDMLDKIDNVFFNATNQVLLLHQGPIFEFTLSVYAENAAAEIDRIVLHLARNNCHTIKKFTLACPYKLPLSIFEFHQLTDLCIDVCKFKYDQAFCGFSSLTSLYMRSGIIHKKALLHFLSNCPLLKSLVLVSTEFEAYDEDITIVELFKCLPMIEHLDIECCAIKCSQDSVPRELPTASVHLKFFMLDDMCFFDKYVLRLLGLVIRSSPNLEKIKLYIREDCEIKLVTLEDYSDIWLEHLKELEIANFLNVEGELEFVKLILAKSPVLKKVIIKLSDYFSNNDELKMLRNLIRSPRISPLAEIIVQ